MIPSENTFTTLIGIEGNQWHYHIPRFQREYVWGKYEWSKLLEDIYENEPGHYMGSVICVHEISELTPDTELIYEVVDGQQRLTTLSILIAAIYHKLSNIIAVNEPEVVKQHDFIIKTNSIRSRLIKEVSYGKKNPPFGIFKDKSLTYCLRVQPSTQDSNLDDYRYILSEIKLVADMKRPKNCGNRRIYKSFKYFIDSIPNNTMELYDLLERVYRLSFIHISEATQSKAFLIFETLNYRGVPLSAIDIIKNKMLSILESKYGEKIEDSYESWQDLLENIPEDKEQDRYLRQFYNAFKYDPSIKIEKINRATSSNIISIYETLIKRDAKNIFKYLYEKSKIYNQFIEPENQPASKIIDLLVELEKIGAATSYTFLLYIFSLKKTNYSESDFIEKTLDLLTKYYFRRNVTDIPGTRDLDTINIELVEQCQKEISQGRKLRYEVVNKTLMNGRGKPASLDIFRSFLSDNLFYNNEGMARYALTKLDETNHTREYAPDLWARNEKGSFIWTVEHVLPQGKNLPKEWIKMMANGNKEEAEKIQGEYVHCLGNLTLTGYNSKLSNQSFLKKQCKEEVNIFKNKIYIGYKNGLALNNIKFGVNSSKYSLSDAPKWTQEFIFSRNEEIVRMLIDLFKFETENVK